MGSHAHKGGPSAWRHEEGRTYAVGAVPSPPLPAVVELSMLLALSRP